MKRPLPFLLPLLLLGSALPAMAHPTAFHSQAIGTAAESGFFHPFSGLDHLCVMVAVGLWAVQLGGRALWLLPSSFVGSMMLGGAFGLLGTHHLLVEHGIVASIVLLGVALGMSWRPSYAIAAFCVGIAGLFHGYAHGSEMPSGSAPLLFLLGMLCATASLHLLGVIFGTAFQRNGLNRAIRVAGLGLLAFAVFTLAF